MAHITCAILAITAIHRHQLPSRPHESWIRCQNVPISCSTAKIVVFNSCYPPYIHDIGPYTAVHTYTYVLIYCLTRYTATSVQLLNQLSQLPSTLDMDPIQTQNTPQIPEIQYNPPFNPVYMGILAPMYLYGPYNMCNTGYHSYPPSSAAIMTPPIMDPMSKCPDFMFNG